MTEPLAEPAARAVAAPAVPAEAGDEAEPYRPVLTDEEREAVLREWLAAIRPPAGRPGR